MSTATLPPPLTTPPQQPTQATPAESGVLVEPLYEIVDGIRVELPEMSILSNLIKSRLHLRLGSFVESQSLGQTVVETLFQIDPETNLQRRPDIAFVSRSRWPLEQETPWEGEWAVVPDLCVEVTSPTDLFDNVMDRVTEYLDYGVQQVWVLWPPGCQVQVFTPSGLQRLTREETLTGGNVVPGFTLKLADLFPFPPRPAPLVAE